MTKHTKLKATDAKPRITKKARLIRMLSTKAGADVAAINGKLGWQSHTTRAAITGLRKEGFGIDTAKPEVGKPTRYRISSTPKADLAKDELGAADAR